MPREGWLKRQADRIQKEAQQWPAWKKEAARSDDTRRQQAGRRERPTPRMRNTA